MSQTPISDAAWHAFNETASAIPFRDEMRKLELELAGLKQRTFLSEAAVTACHSAMLGKVNPKHPAWGVLYAAQDAMATAAPADGGFYGRLAAKATRQRDEARAAKKAEKLARADARKAKAAKKAELGVNLAQKGGARATEATFGLLVTTLEPLRASYERKLVAHLEGRVEAYVEKLATAGGDYTNAYTERTPRGDRTYIPADLFRWFDAKNYGRIATVKSNVAEVIASEAKRQATEEFLSFAAKLTGKVDEAADGVKVASVVAEAQNGVWEWSTTTVTLESGATQVWHTQSIINYSILGKAFNQWPTRLVS